jgi:magnesium chelatase subunit D
MNLPLVASPEPGSDATLVAALFAVDPSGTGGVVLRGTASEKRAQWLSLLRELLPQESPVRRVPLNIHDTALLGGLDLAATLQAGRPIAQQGVLAQADGGIVVLAMAERLGAGAAARLAAVMDTGEVIIERDGVALRRSARLGVVALDEGFDDDEQVPAALIDRLAFYLSLDLPDSDESNIHWHAADIERARTLLPLTVAGDEVLQALVGAAHALGVHSMRGPLLALRVARAAAALAGVTDVEEQHTSLAARLVLAPRATQLPAIQGESADPQNDAEAPEPPPEPQAPDEQASDAPPQVPDTGQTDDEEPDDAMLEQAAKALAERVLQAAQAAIPAGLLAALKVGRQARSRAQAAGRAGAEQKNQLRGRPIGARRGEPRAGARLNVIETLRAAAPWQRLRARQSIASTGPTASPGKRIQVRREDFHVTRFRRFGQTTTVFVVDASGSSALNRLAEAKGAVELLLADCYVRRDQVAVLAFRGKTAELLLPPTRSLARAKRSLAALPGGGGTPLASALDAARELAELISRRGETPIIVLLTDGKANIARDGSPGRASAAADAQSAARQLRQGGHASLLLDTSPQPQLAARQMAQDMGATYLPLPYAGAQVLSMAVRAASGTTR